jgi:dihydrofolate reductase
MALPLVLIVAVARNGVIGGQNKLLWHISSDLRRFKSLTMGKPLLMGRKTWDSIGRPLPGRETIVITRDPSFKPEGALIAHHLDEALRLAEEAAHRLGASEAVVVGGAELYRQLIDQCVELYVTEVGLSPEGDAYFAAPDPQTWYEHNREQHKAGPKDEADFAFVDYKRRLS